MNTNELRRDLRRRRRALSTAEQQRATLAVTARVSSLESFRRATRIAAYVGSKGEVDPMPLLYLAFSTGKRCYLPVLHPFLTGRLWFAPWTPTTPMQLNRFDIPEPVYRPAEICKPQWLDIIVTPLLGFDQQCHRLGMGGGFYDRTLARLRNSNAARGTLLLGVAHDIQECEQLAVAPWDIPLHHIITPRRHYHCESHNKRAKTVD